MTQEETTRALAFAFAKFTAQARGRLVQMLPVSLREEVANTMDAASDLQPSEMSFLEQVLNGDLEVIFAQEADGHDASGLFVEAWPLKVSDVLAMILLHATPQQAGDLLLYLPPGLQGEVLQKVTAQNWTALDTRMGRVELSFLDTIESAWDLPPRKSSTEFSADILRHVSSAAAVRRILSDMYRLDPEPTRAVQDLLYRFEDLVRLGDQDFQTVLSRVDAWDLAIALGSATASLRRRVLANVSERRALNLSEDEEAIGEVEPDDTEAAQRRIVQKVRSLYEEGKIRTYFGSVGIAEEEDEPSPDEGQPAGGSGKKGEALTEPKQKRRNLKGVALGLSGAVVCVALVAWYVQWRSGVSKPNGSSRRATLFRGSDSETPARSVNKKKKTGQSILTVDGSSMETVVGDVLLFSDDSDPPDVEKLKTGDQVVTEAGRRAVLRLGEEVGQIQVEGASSLQIGEKEENGTVPPQLSIRLGKLWVYVKNPTMEVRSPLAVVTASEGALYKLRVVLDASTTISVSRGTVWVKPLVGEDSGNLVLGPQDVVRIHPRGRITRYNQEPESGWLGLF